MRLVLTLASMTAAAMLTTHAVGDDDMAKIFAKQGCRWVLREKRDTFTDKVERSVGIYRGGGNWPRIKLFPHLYVPDSLWKGRYYVVIIFETENQFNEFVGPPLQNAFGVKQDRKGQSVELLARVDKQQVQTLQATIENTRALAIYLDRETWSNLFSGQNLAIRFTGGSDVEFSMSGEEGDAMRKVIADFAATAK